MASRMPVSDRCASHRAIHFVANSLSSPSRGKKLADRAEIRPALRVPTIRSMGISWQGSSWTVMAPRFGSSSSSTAG